MQCSIVPSCRGDDIWLPVTNDLDNKEKLHMDMQICMAINKHVTYICPFTLSLSYVETAMVCGLSVSVNANMGSNVLLTHMMLFTNL